MTNSNSSARGIATDLAAAHKISWSECLALIEAAEADRRPDQLDMLLAGWQPRPEVASSLMQLETLKSTLVEWGMQFWGTPREAALMVWLEEHFKGPGRGSYHPVEWGGATGREAFVCNLHPRDNRGDHSGLHQYSSRALLDEVAELDRLPDTAWKRARLMAIVAERRRRQTT